MDRAKGCDQLFHIMFLDFPVQFPLYAVLDRLIHRFQDYLDEF